jgi:hypothetical protein
MTRDRKDDRDEPSSDRSKKLRQDPKYKNIVWDESESDIVTVWFLGPSAAKGMKAMLERRPRQEPEADPDDQPDGPLDPGSDPE